MILTVTENQEFLTTFEGQYLYVKAAAGELQFYRELTGERFTLSKSSVYRVKSGELGRLIVTPKFSGEIEIVNGWGEFIPPVEGQAVVIESQPAVEIASGQKVALSEPVAIASGQQVALSQPVAIASGQQVALSQPVAIAEGQKVALSAPVAIASGQQVALSEPVAIAEGQKVALSEPVAIAEGQKVALSAPVAVVRDVSSELSVNADELPLVVAKNEQRRVIVIKAPLSNGAAVLIGGLYEVDAGEKIKIETTASIELTGAEGDRVCVLEY
ncbi:hypothetical protein [Vibrio metschnikovii]|uniref:hypothetical protein n=1 Tax=Vibrio metschnikovii TaxID=28172 RepID=UPI00165E6CFC|nr:hypothetical protein [Vibrio metschnikovii]